MPTTFDDATLKITTPLRGAPIRSRGLVLTVVSGADVGAVLRIDDAVHRRVLLGQSPACDVCLTDRSVSRRHASIELEGERLRLLDLGSRNGTLVAGIEVREVLLKPGAEIVLGHTTIRIDLDASVHEVPSSTESRFHRVLGASPEMRRLYPLFERLAGKETHVLLEGEAGTGKELVAECIHDAAGRPDAPFVVCEPAASAPERLDAELFGEGDAVGWIEQANGGSLFIDEPAELPANLQAKLLRTIERKELRRADGRIVPLAVRVFAATRRDLDTDVQNRRFRDDLLLALRNPRIELPPLRKRAGDVSLLTQCFWVALGGNVDELSPSLVQRFAEHDWPGNVRELYYAVGRAFASGDAGLDGTASVRTSSDDFMEGVIGRDLPLPIARDEVIAEFEQRYLKAVLARHDGHVGRAAAASGIGRRYFQKLRARR